MYAIGAIADITKNMDPWVDDCKLHGGAIAERDMVSGQMIADRGARVRLRFAERGVEIKHEPPNNALCERMTNGYQTFISKIK